MTALPPANEPAHVLALDEHPILADIIRQIPGLPERLLTVHQPDPDGRCRALPFDDVAERHRWPCVFHAAAAAVVTA